MKKNKKNLSIHKKVVDNKRKNDIIVFVDRTYSSIAQSVERMTVNHDVVGSSPTGGADKEDANELASSFCFYW